MQDIPVVDAVVFIDAITSPRDIVQSIGRAMRLHGVRGNKLATVYLPMLGLAGGTEGRADMRWAEPEPDPVEGESSKMAAEGAAHNAARAEAMVQDLDILDARASMSERQ